MAVSDLVSCEWLRGQLGRADNSVVILDVTWFSDKDGKDGYLREHIPGAVYLNVMEGAELTPVYPRNLPTPETFQVNARAAGVNADSHVVVYSDTDKLGFFLSGRAWWMFKYFGHEKVSVLNGGWRKWCEEGHPKTSDLPTVTEGNFTAKVNDGYRKSYDEMKTLSGSESPQIVDTRPVTSFEAGHITRATNIPADKLLDVESGKLKDKETLRQVYESAGLDLGRPVVAHCNSGMSSCMLAMTLALSGCQDWAVYASGYKEWQHKRVTEEAKD